MKVIDITKGKEAIKERKKARRKEETKPAKSCRYNGGDGEYFKFSVDYGFKNKRWSFELWAKSRKEAELRVHAIKQMPVEIIQILDEVYQ